MSESEVGARRRVESGFRERAPDAASVFVGSVAHELVGPLQEISLHADRIVRGLATNPSDVASLAAATHAISRVARRAGALLHALRALAGEEEPGPPRVIALAPLIDEVLDLTQARARAAGVIVAARCPSECHVLGHHEELVHALRNLVENAIDAAAGGRPWAHVRVDVAREITCIRVVDGGLGVPRARSATTSSCRSRHTKRREGGSGLGLVIARTLVEPHGRLVDVQARRSTDHVRGGIADGVALIGEANPRSVARPPGSHLDFAPPHAGATHDERVELCAPNHQQTLDVLGVRAPRLRTARREPLACLTRPSGVAHGAPSLFDRGGFDAPGANRTSRADA
ncbi:MAG: HAMP domain-containing histidine kinase [Sandaracinus sp.]|nr:HAMP domain-containing histidine kinase [Sandaracinus sp.]